MRKTEIMLSYQGGSALAEPFFRVVPERHDPDDYNLPDNDDDSRFNYLLPDDEEPDDRKGNPDVSPWIILFKIMTNPVEGWKSLRRSSLTPDLVGNHLFLPLTVLAGLSALCQFYYDSNISVISVLINAVLIFSTYFIGYFIAQVASRFLLPKGTKGFLYSPFGKIFSMISISTLALFQILKEVFPFFEPILYFFPLWTVYIIVKGMKFVKIRENKSSYTLGVMCVTIVGAPIFVAWLFSFIY